MHIVCSSANIYDALYRMSITDNVFLYKDIISPQYYYAHASLIITRSGRNTLSEIKYLDIPAITFVTGDRYRVVEQRQNVNLLHDDCCLMAESNWTKDELVAPPPIFHTYKSPHSDRGKHFVNVLPSCPHDCLYIHGARHLSSPIHHLR